MAAYDVLQKMKLAKLQPPDEVNKHISCFKTSVVMKTFYEITARPTVL